jgi:hypothetical protein
MRRGRGLLISGVVLLVAALAVFGAAVWIFVASVRQGVEVIENSPSVTVHGSAGAGEEVDLRRGAYVVYGEVVRGTVLLDEVEVRGPDGAPLAVRARSGESLTTDGDDYRSVAAFTAPTDGRYTVTAVGEEGSRAVVGPGILRVFGAFGGIFGAFAVGSAGVVTFLAGAGLLIAGAVRWTRSAGPRTP